MRNISYQRILGESIWEKKNGISGNDHIDPCVTDKVKPKWLRESTTLWERRECGCCEVIVIFCTVPKPRGPLLSKRPPPWVLPDEDPLDKCSCGSTTRVYFNVCKLAINLNFSFLRVSLFLSHTLGMWSLGKQISAKIQRNRIVCWAFRKDSHRELETIS